MTEYLEHVGDVRPVALASSPVVALRQLLSSHLGLHIHPARLAELVTGLCVAIAPLLASTAPSTGLSPELSHRELEVLTRMACGFSNGEIGQDLHLSQDTVKTYARRLFRRIGARDRAHAVALGYQQGILLAGNVPGTGFPTDRADGPRSQPFGDGAEPAGPTPEARWSGRPERTPFGVPPVEPGDDQHVRNGQREQDAQDLGDRRFGGAGARGDGDQDPDRGHGGRGG